MNGNCKTRVYLMNYVIACQLTHGHEGVCRNLKGEAISVRELSLEERERSGHERATSETVGLEVCSTFPSSVT